MVSDVHMIAIYDTYTIYIYIYNTYDRIIVDSALSNGI